MTTYNVSIPDNKNSFFLEFLELIGAQYKKQEEHDFELNNAQKKLLIDQKNVSFDECKEMEEFYIEINKKYGI